MTDVLSLSCQELVELVTDYLEGALEPGELARFEAHIARCGGCTAYLQQFRQVIRVTGTLQSEDLTRKAEEELLALFRSWRE
jgi:anti-sigma factor RsiW